MINSADPNTASTETASTEAATATEVYKGGPRTPEGKARSRRNALKHGLRAEECFLNDLKGQQEQLLEGLLDEIQPQTIAERFYVGRAALAMARVEVATHKIEVAAEHRAQKTLKTWMTRERAKVRKAAQNLAQSPLETVAQLESTVFGIEWMAHRWEDLLAPLQAGFPWTFEQIDLAFRLLGLDPAQRPGNLQGDPTASMLDQLSSAANDNTQALEDLQHLVSDILNDLKELGRELYQEVEVPKMRYLADASRIDDTPAGLRIQRYERDAEAAVHRNLKAVEHASRNRSPGSAVSQDVAGPASVPVPDPESPRKPAPMPLIQVFQAQASSFVDLAAFQAPNELPEPAKSARRPNRNPMTLKDYEKEQRRRVAREKRRTEAALRADRPPFSRPDLLPPVPERLREGFPPSPPKVQGEADRLLGVG